MFPKTESRPVSSTAVRKMLKRGSAVRKSMTELQPVGIIGATGGISAGSMWPDSSSEVVVAVVMSVAVAVVEGRAGSMGATGRSGSRGVAPAGAASRESRESRAKTTKTAIRGIRLVCFHDIVGCMRCE